MPGSMGYRLRVAAPSAPHMVRFRNALDAVQELNDNRGYHHIAGFHGAPDRYCWHHQFSSRSPLTARMFLPWHRAYLYHLEQALHDIDPGTWLPWWDWTEGSGIPDAYAEETYEGSNNALHHSVIDLRPPQVGAPIQRATVRNPGPNLPVFRSDAVDADGDGIATLGEVVDYLVDEISDFESFNDVLESVHDSMHGYVGGDMGSQTTAAFDPIFFAHHAMIDRIWYLWQLEHGVENFPSSLKSETLAPFNLTVEQVLNVQELGYEYAAQALPFDDGDGGE